jgi:hypothetical protein
MVELGKKLGLGPETPASVFVAQRSRGKNLDRDVALKLLVPRHIHHTHAARANLSSNAVVRDELADHSLNTCVVRGCYAGLRSVSTVHRKNCQTSLEMSPALPH